jgi:hypothetical protein
VTTARPDPARSAARWAIDAAERRRSTTASGSTDVHGEQWALGRGERLAAHLAACATEDVAVHLPGVQARDAVLEICQRARRRVVALDERPRVVITADGVIENGVVRCLKDEVDAIAPGAELVIVVRNLGDVPLAPTMDAYLDVHMTPGRDVWLG